MNARGFNFLQRQERFDDFIEVYNNERPQQTLDGACPGDLYTPSARVYDSPGEPLLCRFPDRAGIFGIVADSSGSGGLILCDVGAGVRPMSTEAKA